MSVVAFVASAALACGGLFCNLVAPVDQAGEDIVFAVDEARGEVTMHVQIAYQGPADEFAWVVPVPGSPDLEVGTDALFSALDAFRSTWRVDVTRDCRDEDTTIPTDIGPSGYDAPLTVVSEGVVGPYESVVLTGDGADAVVGWLQAHGYEVPDALGSVLAPYVAPETHFVALRLRKGRDVGDLEPLALTWEGRGMSVPIRLTSVAATPDMRLTVYVLGAHRAVPESYLHVRPNPLAVDWWTAGANLEEVVTRAADEAGGHAFFTEYSGPVDAVRDQVYLDSWDRLELEGVDLLVEAIVLVVKAGLPWDDALLGVIERHLRAAGSGLDPLSVLRSFALYGTYGYFDYYYLADAPVDGAAFGAELEAAVLGPRRRAEALLDAHPVITRLVSSASPIEMTVDPTFVFNPDLPPVSNRHRATQIVPCREDRPNVLEIDGFRPGVWLPPAAELRQQGLTAFEWLEREGLTRPAALAVERTGASGSPEVLVDHHDDLAARIDASNRELGSGCGCAAPGTPAGAAAWLLAAAIGVVRTRSRGRRGPDVTA